MSLGTAAADPSLHPLFDAFERGQDGTLLPLGRSVVLACLGDDARGRRELAGLLRAGTLRVAANRVYYWPEARSTRFGVRVSMPRPAEVARVFAEERGWRTAVGQSVAENELGLSTQVPARHVVAMDGCDGRLALNGFRIIAEPAPAWVFDQGEAGRLLVQGTRRWAYGDRFRFPPAADWEGEGMGVEDVAAMVASRARPWFLEGLARDAGALPSPYRGLAEAILGHAVRHVPAAA